MATIFPDLEPLIVGAISSALESLTEPLANDVFVSVKKPDAKTSPYPSKIVTVRSDGGTTWERNLIRRERLGVNVYAATYNEASTLARLVDASLRAYSGGAVKLVEAVLSPVAIANDGKEEQRYMTYEVTVVATDI